MRTPLHCCLLFVTACSGCGYWIFEEEADATSINWYGYILDGPYTGDNGYFSGGTVEVTDLAGEVIGEASEPYNDSPGYWKISVPPEEPLAIHLEGEGMLSSVWRGTSPADLGYWYTGSLFAYDSEIWLPFFEMFEGEVGTDEQQVSIRELGEDNCWLWGVPADPDAWVGASLAVMDGDGDDATVLTYTETDDGLLVASGATDPIDHFLAFNLEPGDISIWVLDSWGSIIEETWPARGGEIVNAWYLELPEEG